MEELKFDFATSIEKELVELGYKRFKYDHSKNEMVEMKLKGDPSYYFSSMRTRCFYYQKNDLVFVVGLQDGDIPPMLCGCSKQVNFRGQYLHLGSCRSVQVHRMLEKIGTAKFIESVECDTEIDFDMAAAEKAYCEDSKKPKSDDKKAGYTYESKTCCF